MVKFTGVSSEVPARTEPTGEKAAQAAWPRVIVPVLPAVTALGLGVWGADRLSLWRDEGMSLLVARRAIPDIFRFLAHLDAVHGAYYLLLHGFITAFGTSELVLRMPSILAFAAAAAGLAVLGGKLISPAGGLVAGLLYAAAPMAAWYAHNARPYALSTALAVLATVLFVRTLEGGGKRRHLAYGASVLALGVIQTLALLVVVAHVVTLLLTRRSRSIRVTPYVATVGTSCVLLTPLIVCSSTQSGAVSWLRKPGFHDVVQLAVAFCGSWSLLALLGAAVVVGCVVGRPCGPVDVRALGVPWLLLPTAVLMLVSQFHPIFQGRYVLVSLPAVALLAAAGLVRLPRGRWLVPPVLLAVAAMTVTPQIRQRDPGRWPDQLREAASIVSRNSRPGDAVVWLPTNRRAVSEVYPRAFGRLRDLTLAVTPTRAENFGGVDVGPADVTQRLEDPAVTRVWLIDGEVPWRGPTLDPLNRAKVDTLETRFHRIGFWRVRGLSLMLFQKQP